MKTPLFFIIIFASLIACSLKTKEQVQNVSVNTVQTDLNSYLYDNFNSIINKHKFFNQKWIEKLYDKNNYKSIWIDDYLHLNKRGDSLLKIFYYSNYYGLNYSDYKYEELVKLKEQNFESLSMEDAALFELLLSDSYMLFGKHLNFGKIDSIRSYSKIERKSFNIDMPLYLAKAIEKDSVLEKLLNLQPKHAAYVQLQKALQIYVQNHTIKNDTVLVPNQRLDSVRSLEKTKKALVIHEYLNKNFNDDDFEGALKKFQKDHGLTPDAIVGKNTAAALSLSPLVYYQNAAISLERWRWKKEWKSSYIYVNIPASILKYYKNDTLILTSNVVVGSVYRRTPEVYSKLSYLVAYPFWHVPRSISVNEILVHAKTDSGYMHKNSYEVFSNKMEKIPLDSIRWDTINSDNYNYYIRQKGGSSNALGLVKFIFHNKYSIYLHDTPSKRYFSYDIRTFSHGCIRVQKAMQLTDTILQAENNTITLDSMNAYILKKEEKKVILKNKLPLYIQYITCGVNKNRLIFYKDIYGYDKVLRKVLFIKN